jgi:hypothetical protein
LYYQQTFALLCKLTSIIYEEKGEFFFSWIRDKGTRLLLQSAHQPYIESSLSHSLNKWKKKGNRGEWSFKMQ